MSYVECFGLSAYACLKRSGMIFGRVSLANTRILPLTDTIADRAISLRQQRRMGLGDAIIAATAVIHMT